VVKRKDISTLFWDQIKSPIGNLFFIWKGEGVLLVGSIKGNYSQKLSDFIKGNVCMKRYDSPLKEQLIEYFEGVRKDFDLKLLMYGTHYQQKVWRELLKVPYGETVSYGELARRVGNPRGARSVGMAVHFNPIGIIVPCHRVIMSNGDIGGYAGGVHIKKWLLEHERSYGSVE
jgi:methylated-DNA-[protein]-cysteine S-methyltransferase